MKAVKNYTSTIPINHIFDGLQKVLVEHGAKQIVFEYGEDGKIYGITFAIEVMGKTIPIKLPARIAEAQALIKKQYEMGLIKKRKLTEPEQAYRVAWRNIWDWVEAQMALLDIKMAKIEEVFLPYMTDYTGKTFFEVVADNKFQLPSGTQEGEVLKKE
jgi:hypothetical protein